MDLSALTDDEINRLYANVYAEKIRRELLRNPNAHIQPFAAAAAPAPAGMQPKIRAKTPKQEAKLLRAKVAAAMPNMEVVCVDCATTFHTRQGCTRCSTCVKKTPKLACVQCQKLYANWGIVSRQGKCATCAGVFVAEAAAEQ